MPEFRCLAATFQLSEEDLAGVPGSILSEAWNTAGKTGVIDLQAWPEPSLAVFEVSCVGSAKQCVQFIRSRQQLVLQEVLACVRRRYDQLGQHSSASTLVNALDYFAVPAELWPTGLQLERRARGMQTAAAKDIVKQLCARVLSAKAQYHTGPYCRQTQDTHFCAEFCIRSFDEKTSSYVIEEAHTGQIGTYLKLPESIRKAVIEVAKAERLHITVQDFAAPPSAYHIKVQIL